MEEPVSNQKAIATSKSVQPHPRKPTEEGYEVVNIDLKDSQLGPEANSESNRPRTPSPSRRELDEEAKVQNAEKEKTLEKVLRSKEK